MVVEMKPKAFEPDNLAQAIGYTIAANSLFDIKGRPAPVGVLTDFGNQWSLVWIGSGGVIKYAETERDDSGSRCKLTRKTALHHIRKHLELYDSLLNDEIAKKRKAGSDEIAWAFDRLQAGVLKRQKVSVGEDNMYDVLESESEVRMYEMMKRMKDTPIFDILPPAECLSYFS
ncbi:UNVERIFIED_CONTAM: hypothetical protein HDU68_005547 [Siphonaria sp. JEL0065]|nr:hypothetical protein HDU68_005547 [Siphonaria sp. JEL0065]